MDGMRFYTGLIIIKETIFKAVANIYLIFSLNEPRTKEVDKPPMMVIKADRRPESHNDEVSIMAPKKKDQNHHQLLRTPDKIKSSRRNKTGT